MIKLLDDGDTRPREGKVLREDLTVRQWPAEANYSLLLPGWVAV